MITEQYVTFETSKMLKNAGFDSIVHKYYYRPRLSGNILERLVMMPRNINQEPRSLSCPTQALAARWLREVHDVHIQVFPDCSCYEDGICINKDRQFYFLLVIFNGNKVQHHYGQPFFNSFESAFEKALQEALQLIIKNKKQ